MSFSAALEHLVETSVGAGLQAFASEIDREWVKRALANSNSVTIRNRKLPGESVVWLVIGMALFRDHSIADVIRRLDLVERSKDSEQQTVAASAIPAARRRVGEEPLRELFCMTASRWSHEYADTHRWRGLAVYAMDGSTLSVQDTEANREHFNLPGTGRGQSGYPKARIVALMAARSHILVDATVGSFRGKGTGESMLAAPLWEQVPDNSLLIADRNFIDYGRFYRFSKQGSQRHWLVRTKRNVRYEVVQSLGEGDEFAEVQIGRNLRREDPFLPRKMLVRLVHYSVDGKPQMLMTSLLDREQWPAEEIIKIYHERWR